MDDLYQEQPIKFLILILVIFLHVMLLFFILLLQFSDQSTLKKYLPEKILSHSPATEEAKVIFYDEPQAPDANKAISVGKEGGKAQQDSDANTQQKQTNIVKEILRSVPDPSSLRETSGQAASAPISRRAFTAEPAEASGRTDLENTDLLQKTTSKTEDSPILDTPPPFVVSSTNHLAPSKAQTSKEKSPSPSTKLTLGDITKGFIQSIEHERGAMPQHQLDAQELARQRYGTRVWALLRQSYKADRAPTQLFSNIHAEGVFVITLDKTGKLLHAELKTNNKTHDLVRIEQILLLAAKKVGLFPPIPSQFQLETMSLNFPLMIQAQEGVHMYDLMYR